MGENIIGSKQLIHQKYFGSGATGVFVFVIIYISLSDELRLNLLWDSWFPPMLF